MQPAVPIPADDGGEASPAWTYRYLIPLGLVLGLLSVLATVLFYFIRVVRSRYQLVE